MSGNADALRFDPRRPVFGSVYGMRPGNVFLLELDKTPIAPGVATHSIIPVTGNGPLEQEDDGVVRYSSAHIEGVDSELVVRSGHSAQSLPQSIEEFRRILYLHAGIR